MLFILDGILKQTINSTGNAVSMRCSVFFSQITIDSGTDSRQARAALGNSGSDMIEFCFVLTFILAVANFLVSNERMIYSTYTLT